MESKQLYKVSKFVENELASELRNELTNLSSLKRKHQYKALLTYLQRLNAKVILVEKEHLSNSYASDYAAEYSFGLKHVNKSCKRLHFFSGDFSTLEKLLNTSQNELQKSYLGCITIRPIPNVLFGTILLAIPQNVKNSNFWAIRKYEIEILGSVLAIDTLAFQEQDGLISACATIALWSSLHALHKLFKTPILSPNVISHRAHIRAHNRIRGADEVGLDINDLCNVIKSVDLYPLVRTINDSRKKDTGLISSMIYPYAKMKLPVMLGLELDDDEQHLITVNGFDPPTDFAQKGKNLYSYGGFVSIIYAHDDQTGPFTKVQMVASEGIIKVIRWVNGNDEQSAYSGNISSIIIALPKGIRIPFEDIYEQVHTFFEKGLALIYQLPKGEELNIIWDIYLTKANDYRKQILDDNTDTYSSSQKKDLLIRTSLPNYIWVARGYSSTIPFIEFVFDAMGFPNSHNLCAKFIFFSQEVEKIFENHFYPTEDPPSQQNFDLFVDHFEDQTNIFEMIATHIRSTRSLK